MARYDVGRIKIIYKGVFNMNTVYEELDCVMYNGEVYLYTFPAPAKGILPTTISYWIKITVDTIAEREQEALRLYNSIFFDIVGPNASSMNKAVQLICATASQMKQEE